MVWVRSSLMESNSSDPVGGWRFRSPCLTAMRRSEAIAKEQGQRASKFSIAGRSVLSQSGVDGDGRGHRSTQPDPQALGLADRCRLASPSLRKSWSGLTEFERLADCRRRAYQAPRTETEG